MFATRKSAFSVYGENKQAQKGKEDPDSRQIFKKQKEKINTSKNDRKIIFDSSKNTQQNGHSNNLATIKKKNFHAAVKKEKKKFLKIPNENLKESINIFNNRGETLNFDFKSKKQIKTKTSIESSPQLRVHIPKDSQKNNSNKAKLQSKIKNNKKTDKLILKEPPKLIKTKIFQDNIDEEMFDSRLEATKLFKSIISPIDPKKFFNNYWEKSPLLIKRKTISYYKKWFSCKELENILKNHPLEFTQNIDITTYVDDLKQNHNPEGRAYAPLVWDFFQQGCSIRLLNPQTYSKNVWNYLSLLQELFGTCVGANVYLTPAGTQGFAPHYDDIEAFVLQLEGKKRWRVYNPLNKDTMLPRFSSKNFKQSDLPQPIIDVTLEAGDLLYFPRGFIHQANACDDIHSLHITVSSYQKNSWGDFLLKLLPATVETAIQEDVEFRKGLPINYLMNMGVAFDKIKSKERTQFIEKTQELLSKLIKYAPIDEAVDQMSKTYLHESLPPCLTKNEKSRSIHGHGESWNSKKNKVENISEIEPDTAIKLIRKNCLRLVVENDSLLVYYNLDNSKIFCEKEAQYLEVELDAAPVIEFLINSYPKYVTVEELPMDTIDEKLTVSSCLYDKGLLVTGEPLACDFEDNSEEIVDDEECDEENGFNSEDYDNFKNADDEIGVLDDEGEHENELENDEEDDDEFYNQEENSDVQTDEDEENYPEIPNEVSEDEFEANRY